MKLKTLNDFKKFSVDDIRDKEFVGVALQSRTKEATKKGYTCKVDTNSIFVHYGLLKQEAVKWYKKIDNWEKSKLDLIWERLTGNEIVYSEEAMDGIKNFIKLFFNITEDDLK